MNTCFAFNVTYYKSSYIGFIVLIFNPSSPKGGATTPQTVFAQVLKNMQPRGKIAPGTFKFIISPHFSKKKKFKPITSPGGRVSFQSLEVITVHY